MPGENEPRSIEDRQGRITEIDSRLAELDTEFSNSQMSDEARDEWNRLNAERDAHGQTVAELTRRRERMAQLAQNAGATERAAVGPEQRIGAPNYIPFHGDDIYDISRLRSASKSEEDFRSRLHDNAKRVIERATFPGNGSGKVISRETQQSHIEQLLARVDDKTGTFAQRMIATGSPVYDRAFGKAVLRGSMNGLSAEEQRALTVYGNAGADGGLAVPFQLDPTVILTSDGAVSPLRQIARVEQIVSKTWEGITSSGITVSRSAEATAATGNEFGVAQPSVSPTRVIADVQFSVELDQDWSQLRNQIAFLLADAKEIEEDTSFVLGNGVDPNPFGVVTTLPVGSDVATLAVATFNAEDDVDALETALPVRFRRNASFLANKAIYQSFRKQLRANGANAGDRWVSHTADMPAAIDGYNAYEASAMNANPVAAARILLFGDFKQFLIVDRLGMTVELNPHVTNAAGRWTGQRSLVAVWRNSSLVLVPGAFRALKGH